MPIGLRTKRCLVSHGLATAALHMLSYFRIRNLSGITNAACLCINYYCFRIHCIFSNIYLFFGCFFPVFLRIFFLENWPIKFYGILLLRFSCYLLAPTIRPTYSSNSDDIRWFIRSFNSWFYSFLCSALTSYTFSLLLT